MEKMNNNYRIVATTDPYHGSRKAGFQRYNDTTYRKVIEEGMTLREAQKELLRMFRESAGRYFENWGVACWYMGEPGLEAYPTHEDGTRSFCDDVITYSIEEEER